MSHQENISPNKVKSPDQERLIARQSKRLSWLLRHGAPQVGLAMNPAGWVEVQALLSHISIDIDELQRIIEGNNKARFQMMGSQIRATQGHSLETTPVTQEALERSWEVYSSDSDWIWHATQAKYLESIRENGILRGDRSHVHLASSTQSKVGKRTGAPIVLKVSVERLRGEGQEVFISPNGVILARFVPPNCILSEHDNRSPRARVARKTETKTNPF